MIFAGFSVLKFLKGFNLFNGEKLGKLLYNLIIVAVCLFIFWRAFLMKTNNTTQEAQTINNTYVTQTQEEDKSFVGVRFHLWKLKLKAEL